MIKFLRNEGTKPLMAVLVFMALCDLLLSGCRKKLVVNSIIADPNGANRLVRLDVTSAMQFDSESIAVSDRLFRAKAIPQLHGVQGSFNRASQVSNVEWDGSGIVLRSNALAGSYASEMIDARRAVDWRLLASRFSSPVGAELPDNSVVETSYAENNMDMTGNILLLHLNEVGMSPVMDSSRERNPVTSSAATVDAMAKLGVARKFTDTSAADDIVLRDLRNGSASAITIAFWVKTEAGYVLNRTLLNVAVVDSQLPSSGERNFLRIRRPENLEVLRGSQTATVGNEANLRVNDGNWHHVAVTWNASAAGVNNLFVYRDGEQVLAQSDFGRSVLGINNPKYCVIVGGKTEDSNDDGYRCVAVDAGDRLSGSLDEIAIFNRALPPSEIRKVYWRGATQVKPSVRACLAENCNDAFTRVSFMSMPPALTGPAALITGLSDRRFFQYKLELSRDSLAVPSPRIRSVEVGPNHFVSGATLTSGLGINYRVLEGLRELTGPQNRGAIKYQLSPNGQTWFYRSNSRWELATETSQANGAGEVSAASAEFGNQFGPGMLFVRAILTSADGEAPIELEAIEIRGQFNR